MTSRLARKYACYYYNRGLDRAKTRDLSGAVGDLRRALEMDKRHKEARNLLGLCLYEMGELGEAISHWMISKKLSPVNTQADHYLQVINSSPGKLANYRQSIRRFNSGLHLMKKGSDDLALIQLRKAVSINPDYVRAWQVLALLYMKKGENTKARKCLKRSLKTDVANPDSIRYLNALNESSGRSSELSPILPEPGDKKGSATEVLEEEKGRPGIVPHFNYEESRPDYRVFVSLMAGILVGIIAVYYLIIPGVKMSNKQEMTTQANRFSNESSSYLSEIDSLEKENSSLQTKLEMEQLEKDSLKDQIEAMSSEKYYDNILNAYVFFAQITAGENVSPMNIFLLRQKMEMVTDKELESAAAKALYDKIMDRFPDVMNASISGQTLFDEGKKFYDAEDYKTANEYFAMAYEQSPDNQEILYLLGRTYQLLDDNTKALTYYREYADKFPDGEYLNTVNQWIDAISG